MSSTDTVVAMVVDPGQSSGSGQAHPSVAHASDPGSVSLPVAVGDADAVGGAQPQDCDIGAPQQKKLKLDFGSGDDQHGSGQQRKIEKLESRLVSLLSCSVCIEMPKAAIYQCTNGHLMCAGCFSHLLADARLRDEIATCPNCRIEINKHSATRNLAVEKAVNELPSQCQYCSLEFPRNTLAKHEREDCEERTMTCKYDRIGCSWRGPFHELAGHQASCSHPSKTGEDVMGVLARFDQAADDERKLYSGLFDLLSYEKIHFGDLQFKPYRTDEFVHKLYYETSRFGAFNYQWVIKARINDHQRDPTMSCERKLSYQLILKSKPATATVDVHFMILKGPFGDMKIKPQIHQFVFTETNLESTPFPLALKDSAECNRLLAAKTIHFRLLAFLQ